MTTYDEAVKRVESGETETPGPGKYEGNADRVLAEMLHEISLDGGNDDEYHGSDFVAIKIGRFVCVETDQGFFGYSVHDAPEAAEVEFDGIREADEDARAGA